ncbi:hypothetical protein AKJ16_DCAP11681 [Drosera capensis]
MLLASSLQSVVDVFGKTPKFWLHASVPLWICLGNQMHKGILGKASISHVTTQWRAGSLGQVRFIRFLISATLCWVLVSCLDCQNDEILTYVLFKHVILPCYFVSGGGD